MSETWTERIERYIAEGRTVSGGKGSDSAAAVRDKEFAMQKQGFDTQMAMIKQLSGALSPYLSGTKGFDPKAMAGMTSQFMNSNNQTFNQAGQMTREALGARGNTGGNPAGGDYARGLSNLLGAKAGSQSQGLLGLQVQNALQAQNNMFNAGNILSGNAASLTGTQGVAGNAMSNALNQFMSSTNAGFGGSFVRGFGSSFGSGLGDTAVQGIQSAIATCPARGSLYLMADGTEKTVESLIVGDRIAGIDDEPQTIEEIEVSQQAVLRVTTDDGHTTRNSAVHAFALPRGGFVVAIHALGKMILTANGPARVMDVKWDGDSEVFNIITDGSHTYRADGVWALGVGEAERHISMERWKQIGERMSRMVAHG
jgi:hypothetical protein